MRLPDPQRSRVVLIGTSEYEDENLPDLPAVGRNVADLKAALTDPVFGIVPERHCDVLADEGDIRLIGHRVRSAARQAEDLLLVYYAGHGLTAGRRHELYLALRHTEWDEPEFNALEYDKLRSAVLNSPAVAKMIILDCCFSGRVFGHSMAVPAAELIDQVEIDGSYVLASAHGNEVALVLSGEDHTAFTGRLLKLLHDGVRGGPEFLTIDDIYRQLRVKMRAEGLPQPQKRATDTADLLALTRNRAFDRRDGPKRPDERFGEFFAERLDVIAEVEREAENSAQPLKSAFASLIIRIEVLSWTPLLGKDTLAEAIRGEDLYDDIGGHVGGLRRLITKLEKYEHSVPEAMKFVSACRNPQLSVKTVQEALDDYERFARSVADRRNESTSRLDVPVWSLLCREFRRMYLSDAEGQHYGNEDDHYGYCGAWYVQLHLAERIAAIEDFRGLSFFAEALSARIDELSNHNSWAVGIAKSLRKYQKYGVSYRAIDEFASSLLGISTRELLVS